MRRRGYLLCLRNMYVSSGVHRLVMRVVRIRFLWTDVPGVPGGLPDMRRRGFRQWPLLGPCVQQLDGVQLLEWCMRLERTVHLQLGLDSREQRDGLRAVRARLLPDFRRELSR